MQTHSNALQGGLDHKGPSLDRNMEELEHDCIWPTDIFASWYGKSMEPNFGNAWKKAKLVIFSWRPTCAILSP